jgi:hypothetical protein
MTLTRVEPSKEEEKPSRITYPVPIIYHIFKEMKLRGDLLRFFNMWQNMFQLDAG